MSALRKARRFPFGLRRCEAYGVPVQTARRALKALEAAGLVVVKRHPGRNPIVTLMDVEEEEP
jgi:DNA-binding GntR family transcriptional regulator